MSNETVTPNRTINIAQFFVKLDEMKKLLQNELLPLALHLGVNQEDAALYESLEIAATEAEEFFVNNKLQIAQK